METNNLTKIFNSISNNILREEFRKNNITDEAQIKEEIKYVIANRRELKNLIKILFESKVQTPNTIFSSMEEIEAYLDFNDYANELAGYIVLEILNDLDYKNAEKVLKELEDTNKNYFWSIIRSLPYILSNYKLEPTFASEWFYKIGENIKDDLASGEFFKALGNLSFNFPETALKILKIYLSQRFNGLQMFLGAIILGSIRAAVRQKSINMNIDEIEDTLRKSNDERFRIVYYKSWITSYNRNLASFNEVFQIIKDAHKGTQKEIEESFLIMFLISTKDLNNEDIINEMISWYQSTVNEEIPAEAKFHVINTVYWIATYDKTEKIDMKINEFKSVFGNLFPVETKFSGIWRKIEELLTTLIRRKRETLFKEYLNIIIQYSSDSFLELLNKDHFRSLEYYLKGTLLDNIFSQLLFSEKEGDIRTAIELFKKLNNATIVTTENKPSKELLLKILLEFSRSVLLAKGTSKFLLMIEPFFRDVNEELKSEFTREMLFQAVNYPDTCLKEWKELESLSEILKTVIERADLYFEKLDEIKDLPGRNFNYYKFIEGAELERKIQSRSLNEQVRERSVLLKLFKHTQILYGDAWSLSGERAPQKFHEIRYAIELPRIEGIDPEGMVLKRMFINTKLIR